MIIFGLFLVGSLTMFHVEHQDFFETVQEQQKQGYTWRYVGEQLAPRDRPYIGWYDEEIEKDVIFWELKKKK